MREPLDALVLLRRRAVDDARRDLADGIAASDEAATVARAAEREIEHEAERASDPSGCDRMVEAFAAWLPGARQRAAEARSRHERLEAEASRCRAALTACRTALESLEALLASRAAAVSEREGRRQQQALDEAGRRRPGLLE